MTPPGDGRTRLPALPSELDGCRPGLRREAPRLGEHTREVLEGLGVDEAEVAELGRRGIVVADSSAA